MSENVELFSAARERFSGVVAFLESDEAKLLEHSTLEEQLQSEAREVFRLLFQDHLELRALTEARLEVADAGGVADRSIEEDHARSLVTVFGEVTVRRRAYRKRGHENLHPQDGALNLPEERHSHGLRRLAATESCRGSYDAAREAVLRHSGVVLGKRQLETLVRRVATDFDAFYASNRHRSTDGAAVLVLSVDGKGIVMRPDALRPATATAAEKAQNKLGTRLSKGEKRDRKRLAEVGAVYDLVPVPRRVEDVLAHDDGAATPKAADKWVTASVANDAASVIAEVFDEADRRDPLRHRAWMAVVDGNQHQIDRILAEASARGVTVPIVVDFVHVLEYLWKAAWSFFHEGDRAAEAFVRDKALGVLRGNVRTVAASIRRKATARGLAAGERRGADLCASYLVNKAAYLDYRSVLEKGWPIASGVIEGTCRYLVADRMDITGARWSVEGAEAVLRLRALRANGDFDEYFTFHLARERQRVHEVRYAEGAIPRAA